VDPTETRQRFRAAMEAGDHAAAVSTFAPEIVLRSPIIGRRFEGRQAVGDVMGAVIEVVEDLRYTAEAAAPDGTQILAFSARVRGREIDAVDLLRVDGEGLISEFVVHIRPMAGLAAVAAALGPRIARGPVSRVLVRVFAAPLLVVLTLADPLVPRLIRTRSG
jgi:SnoaL-like protein